jgi:hypothetical protein
MLTFGRFSGINNQKDSRELVQGKGGVCALTIGRNIDLDLEGRPRRRSGFGSVDTGVWGNVWEGTSLALGTKDGDLVNIDTSEVLYQTFSGTPRTWYDEWPDGRVAFSNGLICGITDGTAAGTTKWGVPLPASVGSVSMAAGDLFPGRYKYALTHYRIADGLEGGPTYAGAFTIAEGEGALVWSGLPVPPAGHGTRIYVTSHNDDILYFASSTTGTAATFSGKNEDLQLRLKTDNFYPAPAGICLAFWRGRALTAVGTLLIASRSHQWELFQLERDVVQMPANITMVKPVEGGIWVGTTQELCFLSGQQWDSLAAVHNVSGPVALGSGVHVDAKNIAGGEKSGPAAICIADGYVTACFGDGSHATLTDQVYRATGTEYAATFRMAAEIPQYIAIER